MEGREGKKQAQAGTTNGAGYTVTYNGGGSGDPGHLPGVISWPSRIARETQTLPWFAVGLLLFWCD